MKGFCSHNIHDFSLSMIPCSLFDSRHGFIIITSTLKDRPYRALDRDAPFLTATFINNGVW
jgi:hypothetical protein